MKTVYLIRHGTSLGNKKRIIQGHTDCDLTFEGKKQALYLNKYLAKNDITFDEIYSSDLKRAYFTATISTCFMDKPVIKSEKLREINLGIWQGKSVNDILTGKTKELWFSSPSKVKIKNAETLFEATERIYNFIYEKTKKSAKNKLAFFTHGAVLCLFLSKVKNTPIDKMWDYKHENTAFSILTFFENEFGVIKTNHAPHLKKRKIYWY